MQKLRSVTAVMGHTGAAAKRARARFFAMMVKFGLPTLMFTITPDDSFNLRVKIMANEMGRVENPYVPETTESNASLNAFAKHFADIRVQYPGKSNLFPSVATKSFTRDFYHQ